MDTELLKHIDWTNDATYKDLAKLLLAYADGLKNAPVTSGSNGISDGYVKRALIEELKSIADAFNHSEHWLMVRPEVEITRGQGKVNN